MKNKAWSFNLHGTGLSIYPKHELVKDARQTEEGSGFTGITLTHSVRSETEFNDIVDKALPNLCVDLTWWYKRFHVKHLI